MKSSNLLFSLISLAAISGAWIYGYYIKNANPIETNSVDVQNRLKNLELEIEQLKLENLTLRDLAQTDGDFIPDTVWISWIEKNNGFDFQTLPQVIYATEDEILKSASSAWTENFGETGMVDRDYLFYAIGLIPQSNLTIQFALAESGPGTRRALYDYKRGCILVANDFDDKNLFDKCALTQAFSVAILEQNFPITKPLNDDRWLARRMVIHGNAIGIRQAYMNQAQKSFQLNGAQVKPPIDPKKIRNAALDFHSLPSYVKNTIGAHAAWGRFYVDSQKQDSREEQISAALSRATSSLAVLKNEPMPNYNITATKDAIVSTSLGAIGVLFHAQIGDIIKNPKTVALDLISDKLEFFNKDNKKLFTEWTLTFSSIESAKQFSLHLKDVKPDLKVSVEAGTLKVHVEDDFLGF